MWHISVGSSVAKGPTNMLLHYFKTSESCLSNGVLFISIRQIFDHISASKNKVSETTFSGFSEISRTLKKFPRTQKCAETARNWNLTKVTRKCYETTEFRLSNGVLFISIRQIFDHISDSENKVSGTTNSKCSRVRTTLGIRFTSKRLLNSLKLRKISNPIKI